jgi:ADP-ribosylation factor GTPase-activating protein 2/3
VIFYDLGMSSIIHAMASTHREEAKNRLTQFQGKSGFGSTDYYGRDESAEDLPSRSGRSGMSSLEGVPVSDAAREFASKFVEQISDDLDGLKRVVTSGSSKFADFLQDMQSKYNY